jgi:hypothetical protein
VPEHLELDCDDLRALVTHHDDGRWQVAFPTAGFSVTVSHLGDWTGVDETGDIREQDEFVLSAQPHPLLRLGSDPLVRTFTTPPSLDLVDLVAWAGSVLDDLRRELGHPVDVAG